MVGTHLHRNITWAEQAKPLFTYFARTSHLLQQGLFVADLAYLLDEGAPSTPPIWGAGTRPSPPDGYDYDFINADVLLNRLSVADDGRLLLPDGMSYRVLILPESRAMRPELARKLRDLVAAGATIVGPRPTHSPSLANYPTADADLHALAADLWGDLDGASRTVRHYGKGRVIWGQPLNEVLPSLAIPKDFDYARGLDAEIAWLHRRTSTADIYYLANTTDHPQTFDARFRVAGKEAELWHADTGKIEPASYRIDADRTTVPLRLAERQSLFVVFRKKAALAARTVASPAAAQTLASLDRDWTVRFQENLGASHELSLAQLAPWSEHADDGVKYFSGSAVYTKRLHAPRDWFLPDTGLFLDLGHVGDIAEVTLNGRPLGLLWHPPYEIDITGALHPGDNLIEIKVTNQWTNRLIGDRNVSAEKRVFADSAALPNRMRGPEPKLPDSGLIGPVRLLIRSIQRVADNPDGNVAGISANYTEALAGNLTLPDPLKLANGQPVSDAKTWFDLRRPELLRLFEENQFGRVPAEAKDISFDVFDAGTPAFDGQALRKQITIYFSKNKANGPHADVLLYLPADASGPVPVLLCANFSANNLAVDDPGVKVGRLWNPEQKQRVPATPDARRFGRLNVLDTLARGFGIATVNYADFDPDAPGAIAAGVRQLYLAPGQTEPAPDEWGTISAWSWGLSRVLDYFETDTHVDAKRVALFGVSRLGKTVLWTGARDPRFALIIASCSGEGGAALSRRNYGETVAHLTAPTRYPYQFAANYARWAGRAAESPVEANLLVSLIAPRPLLLQTGDTDIWSDPKGEFLAALSATPVYELLGRSGLPTPQMPQPGQLVGDALGYYLHAGGHGTVPSDWNVFLQFAEKHLGAR